MTEVFVDTHAWVASRVRTDRHHEAVQRIRRALSDSGIRLVTSQAVLSETYTMLAVRSGHRQAVRFGEVVRGSQDLAVVYTDADLDSAAWELFVKYDDKLFSYVDCISFAIMQQRGIGEALTFDQHFEQVGFRALLREA